MDVQKLLESDAHHHKVGLVTAGKLLALVGGEETRVLDSQNLQVLFGLVLLVANKSTKRKDKTPSERILMLLQVCRSSLSFRCSSGFLVEPILSLSTSCYRMYGCSAAPSRSVKSLRSHKRTYVDTT